MDQHTYSPLRAAMAALALAGLSACGGGGGDSGATVTPPATTLGTLGVSMTDAPSCGFDAVNVTVTKIRVNQSASAADTDAGWTDITLNPALKINLLNLTNGALQALGQTSLSAGHYSQLRLVLDPNTGGSMANSVVVSGSTTERSLDTPSAVQSGIKLVNSFDVAAGQRVDLVLDFDACKSIVTRGNGQYALKPVVKVVPTALNGIGGFVASALLSSNVKVSAQQNGAIVSATTPNPSTGEFALTRLPLGNYDVVVTADSHAAAVVGAVPVTSSSTIIPLSTAAAPITLPASVTGSISGTVTLVPALSTTDSAIGTYVAAKQSFAAGPTVTIQYQGASVTDGTYTLSNLPVAAPQYAVYSATLPLQLSSATGVLPGAGKYIVEGSAAGYTTSSQPMIDISTQNQTGINFNLKPAP